MTHVQAEETETTPFKDTVTYEEMEKILEEVFFNGGHLSKIFDGYNYRPDQMKMAKVSIRALADGKPGFVEAGTGTGKSFGSLLPAAIYAGLTGKRVVLVTHNIALQQQLYDGDVPFVKKVMDMIGLEFSPALLKGKGNFLCVKGLKNLMQSPGDLADDLKRFMSQITNGNNIVIGDKDKLPEQPNPRLWKKVSYTPETNCNGCPFEENCFVKDNKAKAEKATLVISNQFMLMNDVKMRLDSDFKKGSLPDYGVVIVDEAHHLEHVASGTLGVTITYNEIRKEINSLKWLFSDRGPLKPEIREDVRKQCQGMIEDVEKAMYATLTELRSCLDKQHQATIPLKFVFETDVVTPIKTLVSKLMYLSAALADHDKKLTYKIKNAQRWLDEKEAQFLDFSLREDYENYVYHIRKDDKNHSVEMTKTPIDTAGMLNKALFSRMPVIMTSATMKFDKDLSFFAKTVGDLNEGEFHSAVIDAPFDYKQQACFYVPSHALDGPTSKEGKHAAELYDAYALTEMYQLVQMSKGRAFLLFTSTTALKMYYEQLAPHFEKMGFKCFYQGGDLDRNSMISEFISHKNAVLFGAATFWEGISVKGRELSLVVIHKLPFDPPNPVTNARQKFIRDSGGNEFLLGVVFPAIIKYKQGFGRLIRHEEDKGVFAVLDGRILSKNYATYFQQATPICPRFTNREDLLPYFE